jgi:ABC-2 type transport system permease protein
VRLIRSELLKIRTTKTWWWLGLGALVTIALALLFNIIFASQYLSENPPSTEGAPAAQAEVMQAQQDVVVQAANIYTSGQYFGLLFVMLLGILQVTTEYHHQTATMTFLTTPRRTIVILSKLATVTLVGAAFWLVTSAIDLAVGSAWLVSAGHGSQLGEWGVTRAILLNLLAYVIWAIFGVGFGTLITNQLGAVITAAVLYLVGTQAAGLIFFGLSIWLDNTDILEWQVIVPSIASSLMISGAELPGSPPQWVGAAVLIGYAVVTGTVGVLLTRRRDVS